MGAIIPKIRAGNQFEYLWAIERAGVAVDLTTATDIELSYGVGKPCADYSTIPFTVVNTNKISSSHLYGVTGTYNLKLEFKIDGEQSTIDIDAFKIVPRSEDASDSTQFAVTSDMAIGFKGEKLTFADLTPSDIAELRRPANDAIASIQAVEVSVEQAESLRVQAEIDRQANTGTAIQNAQTATTNANTATTSANNAATLANTKAGLADTAATNANNVANGYAAELALKEVKSNKQNSLVVDGTGTKFPTVDAVNTGLSTKQATLVSGTNIKTVNGTSLLGSGDVGSLGVLVADYTHTTNKEVVISAYDINADTFTSVAHGLANGDVVAPILNSDVVGITSYSVYIGGMENITYYVVNKTDDTFQLSKTAGGAAINLTTNATTDLTKWHFEVKTSISISNIPASTDIRLVIIGKQTGGYWSFTKNSPNTWESGWNTYTGLGYPTLSPFNSSECGIYMEAYICVHPISYIRLTAKTITNNGLTTFSAGDVNSILSKNKSFTNITSLSFSNNILFNGSNIKIYKVK